MSENNSNDRGLSVKQVQALSLLLYGYSDNEVADKIGMSRQTIYMWKHKEEAFMKEYINQKQSLLDNANSGLMQIMVKSRDVLLEELNNRESPHRVKIAMAYFKFEIVEKLEEHLNFQLREVENKEIDDVTDRLMSESVLRSIARSSKNSMNPELTKRVVEMIKKLYPQIYNNVYSNETSCSGCPFYKEGKTSCSDCCIYEIIKDMDDEDRKELEEFLSDREVIKSLTGKDE
jgi:DNA-binding CsgD family transcriptional regulator